ncbi:MAG TPA: serine--tRNA ligase [Candidatus Hydrogenedentes bacterium]|jgi:seryl-tRNA synthetase|nr:MAG: Serine--tRNA ligase [Candidatus Hydrogenedentes bacterium ADurb.Bin170]HNZ47242.1 serine--tRNA ligase [Candidatus Hydrogenedentota bacterium]HOD94498.1 serine--tRNA ligase [Candidatus Hydrogenedentota bacterium]HOH41668.1 serine--tRNA ligase [Candidatus Hydrogenedentota bacterium]HOM47258.1 serine--tRNA ligase [Candidatus Hydrogenedentota bacterium]
MFDIRLIRSNPELVRAAMEKRNAPVDLDTILAVDARRRSAVYEMEQLRARQNKASETIAQRKKNNENADDVIAEMKQIKEESANLDLIAKQAEEDLEEILLSLPNLPDESVPAGKNEADNQEIRRWGEIPSFNFEVRDHVDIAEKLGIVDFSRGAKISGARFTLSLGYGARLERALINFMLDIHTQKHGYQEALPPFLVNTASVQGTGQLPKFSADLFKIDNTDYWLIPTAEVPVTNIHRDEILSLEDLPKYYVAHTPCFRSEAGSYGKDTRGMIRVHQFNKVELVKFTTPESSWEELEKLTANAEYILQQLGLAYRVVCLCGGDLGFSAAKTYDLEVWVPAQNTYREISSCSNFTDFQARRANIRFKRDKKPEFVHTLNGSGLAVGRTVVAILENYQQEDGSVIIPEALRPYMGGLSVIPAQT